jgi:hypothetical protein
MTLSAQAIRFRERYTLSAGQVKPIAIARVVTIEAPAMLLVMLQYDLLVHPGEDTASPIGGHTSVTRRARENAFRERRRRNLEALIPCILPSQRSSRGKRQQNS